MSQVFLKRCDRCHKVSTLADVPNPEGWQSLGDLMHGTLAVIDLCPECQEQMGVRELLATRVQQRALGLLRDYVVEPLKALGQLPVAVNFEEIEAAIEAGEYDEAFAKGDGVDLAELVTAGVTSEGEVVDE